MEARRYIVDGMRKYSFYLKITGTDGKAIPQLNPNTGLQKNVNGKFLYMEERIDFDQTPIDPKKPLIRSCFFDSTASEGKIEQIAKKYDLSSEQVFGDIIRTLDALVDDPASSVQTVDQFEQRRNPAAYAEMKQRKAIEAELVQAKQVAAAAEKTVEVAKQEVSVVQEKLIESKTREEQKDAHIRQMQEQMEKLMKRGPGRPPSKAVTE